MLALFGFQGRTGTVLPGFSSGGIWFAGHSRLPGQQQSAQNDEQGHHKREEGYQARNTPDSEQYHGPDDGKQAGEEHRDAEPEVRSDDRTVPERVQGAAHIRRSQIG